MRNTAIVGFSGLAALASACLTSIGPGGTFQCDPATDLDCVDAGASADAGIPPTAIFGLKLWLAASSLSQSDGTPVTTWLDSRGAGISASQFAGGTPPTFRVAAVNNQPAVSFSSANHSALLLSSNVNGPSYTVVAVGALAGFRLIFLGGGYAPDGGGAGSGDGDDFFGPSSNQVLLRGSGDQGLTAASPAVSGAHVYSATVSTGAATVWVDGNEIGVGLVPATNFDSVGTRSAGHQFSDGDVAELVVFDRALSDQERTAVESYLNENYGLF